MSRLFLLVLVWLFVVSAQGEPGWRKGGHGSACPVCYGSDKVVKSFTPPPAEVMNALKSTEKKSTIVVDYSLFPEAAKSAFAYAVNIWEHLIESDVPIHVLANWRRQDEGVLGSCYPYDLRKNFPGAPRKEIYYPIALAEKLAGKEMTGPSQPDIAATFNRDINWYFGTDGKTPYEKYDFVSVVLHELGHGLGFYGFFSIANNLGSYDYWQLGDATAYDLLVEHFNGNRLLDQSKYPNPSQSLKNALVSGWLFANSPVAAIDDNGSMPRLYAPSSWNGGSSIYHLNEDSYVSSGSNSLMTPFLGRGEAVHDPGSVTMGMMADLGWKTMKIDLVSIKDQEVKSTVDIHVSVQSDFKTDTARLYFVYSTDSFSAVSDTVVFRDQGSDHFRATWTPPSGADQVQYYVSSADVKGRVFRYPVEAPLDFFTVNFGVDTIRPEISHDAVAFLLDAGDSQSINARVEDNLGVDTVYVEYTLNGAEVQRFGLERRSEENYSSFFPFNSGQIRQGDEVAYRIVAVDASATGNTRIVPSTGMYALRVEKVAEPVYSYSDDFNVGTLDFVLTDFSVSTLSGFTNGALHSSHPYKSPETDEAAFDFVSVLKIPVILGEGATMSFDEIVLVEPGESGSKFGDVDFYDYVIVEGSKDWGKSWLPLTDGYDSRANYGWNKKYTDNIIGNNSRAVGSSDLFINRQFNMMESGNFEPGDTILVRFRIYSDPYGYGWGWAIDNLVIQSVVSASPIRLSSGNFYLFPNPFDHSFSVVVDAGTKVDRLELELFNMYGQRVWGKTLQDLREPVSVDVEVDYAPGVYLFVALENGVRVFSRKMVSK